MSRFFNKCKGLYLPVITALLVVLVSVVALPNFQKQNGKVVFTIGPASASASSIVNYVCTGVADNVIFQQALNDLPATGGEIDVLTGTYNFAATVLRPIDDVIIKGMGAGTVFIGANPSFSAGARDGWQFRDFEATGITVAAATNWTQQNVTVGATYYSYRTSTGITASSITATGLTIGRVPYVGTGGLVSDSANLTWSYGTGLTFTGNTLTSRIAPPGAATTAVNVAAGLLNGAYYYRITYTTATGETEIGTVSAVVNPVNQQVNLTAISVSADPRVTGKNIYRTVAGGNPWEATFQWVALIAAGTLTYTDNTADVALGAFGTWFNTTGGEMYLNGSRVLSIGGAQSGNLVIGGNSNPSGPFNTVVGTGGQYLTTGSGQTLLGCATGSGTAIAPNIGHYNVYIGDGSGMYTTTGSHNVGVGDHTFYNVLNSFTGQYNVALGSTAMWYAISAAENTALGYGAGYNLTTGSRNILIGKSAGDELTVENDIFAVDSSIDTKSFMRGVMGGSGRSLTLNAAESAGGGGSLKSFTLNLTNQYWDGALDTAWNAKIFHSMITAAGTPKSTLSIGIGAAASELPMFALTNDNGTLTSNLFAAPATVGVVRQSTSLSITNYFYHTGASYPWVALISHEQFNTGVATQGASYLKFKIDGSEIFRLTRENTTNSINMYASLNMGSAGISSIGGLTTVDTCIISPPNTDVNYFMFKARDSGVGLVEVGRVVGAADPYFSFGTSQTTKFYNSGSIQSGVGVPIPLTISAGGDVTVTSSYATLAGDGGIADNLDTINGGVNGQTLILRAVSDAVDITVRDDGNIKVAGAIDFVLDSYYDTITLIYDSTLTKWLEISRATNG
jgi:hypothetical protein